MRKRHVSHPVAWSVGAAVLLMGAVMLWRQPLWAEIQQLQYARAVMPAPDALGLTPAARQRLAHAQNEALHPQRSALSTMQLIGHDAVFLRRALQARAGAAVAPAANFVGNSTVIQGPGGQLIGLQRQPDCSLTLYNATYTLSGTSASVQVQSSTADYGRVLHTEAGLTSVPDVFASGCQEPLAVQSRIAAYLGKSSQNLLLGVGVEYVSSADSNGLLRFSVNATTQSVNSYSIDTSDAYISLVAVADLNGDGLGDVIGLNSNAGSVTVWLAHADGTYGTSSTYSLGGTNTDAAVPADVDGDGKMDLVVATHDANNQATIWVLTGRGDGTFNTPVSLAVPTPILLGTAPATIMTMTAADLRNTGHPDVVASNGLLLLNNGHGVFTAAASYAFTPIEASSSYGPDVIAADFNKDGKPDLALNYGDGINIYLGNGDGSFTAGNRYASINDDGYMTAADLDGDGNIDLFVGVGNGGSYGSGQSGASEAYALLGNGDGSFRGAPILPFIYTGTNLIDLNGDGHLDAVGLQTSGDTTSFVTYLGDGKGDFTAHSSLTASSITLYGSSYQASVDSFGLGDITGDGKLDLVWIVPNLDIAPPGQEYTYGYLLSVGDGQGGFAAPSFVPLPTFLAPGDIDENTVISNMRLADINGDGKLDAVYSYRDDSYNTHNTYAGIVVQLGNGDGSFGAAHTLVMYQQPYAQYANVLIPQVVAITDLNHDGKLDLVMVQPTGVFDTTLTTEGSSILVALGNGDGTFATPNVIPATDKYFGALYYGTQYTPLVVADMNGDGVPDLVSLGASTAETLQVAVELGKGDGTFKAPIKTTYEAQYLNDALAVADFNGDGKPDIAMAGYLGSSDSGISWGNGDGTFITFAGENGPDPAAALYLGGAADSAVALDLTGDGRVDLLIGNTLLPQLPAGSSVFALTASPASGTVTAGTTAQTTLTVTPDGFNGSVSLTCSGLPAGASCQFSAASLSLGGGAAHSTLSIQTTARTAAARAVPPALSPLGLMLAGLLLPLSTGALTRRQRLRWALLLVAALELSACGGSSSDGAGASSSSSSGSDSSSSSSSSGTAGASSSSSGSSSSSSGGAAQGTPAGTYNIQITASASAGAQTVTYALTVQ